MLRLIKSLKVGVPRGANELEVRLQQFLLKYRKTPHAITGQAPSELLCGYRPTTRLYFLRPSVKQRVDSATDIRNKTRSNIGRESELTVGEKVSVRFWYGTRRWRPGVIASPSSDSLYDVQVGDSLHRRYAMQLLPNIENCGSTPETEAAHEH